MLSELDTIGNLELSKLEYEEFSGLFFEDDQEGGQDGTNGKDGADGVGVQSIELTVDAEGKVTGGTVYFNNNTSSAITITQVTT